MVSDKKRKVIAMLNSLKLENYRAFKHLEVNNLSRVNLFVGQNNSGKTSILEAAEMIIRRNTVEAITYSTRRRAEILHSEKTRLNWNIDICHLFNGHVIDIGTAFAIKGYDNNHELLLRGEIHPHDASYLSNKQLSQLQLFADEDKGEEKIVPQYTLSIENNIADEPLIIPLSEGGGIPYDLLRRRFGDGSPQDLPLNFIRSEALDSYEMRALWDDIALTDQEFEVIKVLQILEPNIERIAFLSERPTRLSSAGGIYVKLKNVSMRIPIGSFGDGIRHLLGISLAAIRSANGYLMIDEIDTGLHHTVMEDMWRVLIETAHRLDVQVFATTHNLDCVRSLAWLHEKNPTLGDEVRLHRVDKNREKTTVYSPDEILVAAEQHMELRG